MARNESQTRQDIINHQLAKAGWGRNNCPFIEEYLIRVSEDEEDYVHRGFADYALLGTDRKPIAIVEANRRKGIKRSSKNRYR